MRQTTTNFPLNNELRYTVKTGIASLSAVHRAYFGRNFSRVIKCTSVNSKYDSNVEIDSFYHHDIGKC